MEEEFYKGSPILDAYFTCLHYFTYEFQEIIRICSWLREDDLNYSHVLELYIKGTHIYIYIYNK